MFDEISVVLRFYIFPMKVYTFVAVLTVSLFVFHCILPLQRLMYHKLTLVVFSLY